MIFNGRAKMTRLMTDGKLTIKVINQACLTLCSTAFISCLAIWAEMVGISAKVNEEEEEAVVTDNDDEADAPGEIDEEILYE